MLNRRKLQEVCEIKKTLVKDATNKKRQTEARVSIDTRLNALSTQIEAATAAVEAERQRRLEAEVESLVAKCRREGTDQAIERDSMVPETVRVVERDKFSGKDHIVRAPKRIGTVRNKPVRNNPPIVRTLKGDWVCNKCKFSVFAKRKKCPQCDTPCGRGR